MKEYNLPLRRRFVVSRTLSRILIEWYAPHGRGWTIYLWPRKHLMWYAGRTLGGWNIDIGPVELFLRGRRV